MSGKSEEIQESSLSERQRTKYYPFSSSVTITPISKNGIKNRKIRKKRMKKADANLWGIIRGDLPAALMEECTVEFVHSDPASSITDKVEAVYSEEEDDAVIKGCKEDDEIPPRFDDAGGGGGVEKTFKCELCQRKFYRNCSLALHMKCHSEDQICNCKVCGKNFARVSAMEKHAKSHNQPVIIVVGGDSGVGYNNKLTLTSKICQKSFSDKEASHSCNRKERFACELCDAAFDRKQPLVAHIEIAHNNERPFICCHVCKARFQTEKQLSRHNARGHRALEKFKISCQFCEGKFSRGAYKRHLKIHINDRLRCDPCKIEFTQRSSLVRHLKRLHSSLNGSK